MTDQDLSVFELHDTLAEDLKRIFETWGLATVIHGVKCVVLADAESRTDEEERGRLFIVAAHLDAAWVDAEGGER